MGTRSVNWTITRTTTTTACFAALLLLGCDDNGTPAVDSGPDPQIDADAACLAAGPLARNLTTDDGVSLIADLYTTGTVGDPGVILLHMIPPGNTKDNYPATFIEPLVARGFQVLNVNRRGAPGSGGEAMDAYLGDNGKFDALAARDYLVGHPCAVPDATIAVVGASNGTTTAVDYAVYAANRADIDRPAAMVFLSGGSYTENQNSIANSLTELADIPIQFAFPSAEAAWNRDVEALGVGAWSFVEYDPGDHGTRLFDAAPASMGDVTDFLDNTL